MVRAATRLFRRDGYVNTTMNGIAAEAGVAVQTLYLAFGSKVAILAAAHDFAVAGDDTPVPLLRRPWVASLAEAPDWNSALVEVVARLTESTERVAPIFAVIQSAAADPSVAELLAEMRAMRSETCRALADLLISAPGVSARAQPARIGDLLYAVLGVETYQLLVGERGWDRGQWEHWGREVIGRELLEE